MLNNRKAKSNRAQADYFELLVCQYICHLYSVTFSYSKNLAQLSSQVLKLRDGKERLNLQNQNLIKIAPRFKEILDFEIKTKGKIIKVEWIGRNFIITQTTSDVDAYHINQSKTRFSIKSVAGSGTGTIKNLGMSSLMQYLNIYFEKEYEEMWKKLREQAKEFKISRLELKNKINKNKKLLKWANDNGRRHQIELNEKCYKSFNSLPKRGKNNFLNFILDAKDPDLYVVIANENGVVLYKPIENQLVLKDTIKAEKNSDVGYTIFINRIPTYRVQTNATNGIGISPFCQRVFKV